MRLLAVTAASVALAHLHLSPAHATSPKQLVKRERHQHRTLRSYAGTLRFFHRHPRLARTPVGRRASWRARVWVRVVRRELGDTRRERRQYHRRSLQSVSTPTVDSCLSELIARESGWSVTATNPSTGAYGLPQALPGSKMATAGPDWATNPRTQIRWMLGYVNGRYGGSCGALAFQQANGWY